MAWDRERMESTWRSWQRDLKDATRHWKPIHWGIAVVLALVIWTVFSGVFWTFVALFKAIGSFIGAIIGVVAGLALFVVGLAWLTQALADQITGGDEDRARR
ncbi:MAG: hypothetical protein ACFB22_11485 [Rhodothalassiaceae bacterium]